MTKLPATVLEAEATNWARDTVREHKKAGGIFSDDAHLRYGRAAMKVWILSHPFGADDIVYFAENNSKEADIALREVIAEKTNRGEQLGAVLGAYNIRLLSPTRSQKHGPGRADNFVRDMGIVMLVAALIERFGLAPTWNRKARKPAAPTIAATVLTEAGIVSMSSRGVEKVWGRYLPVLFAGTRYAARSRFALASSIYGAPGIFDK